MHYVSQPIVVVALIGSLLTAACHLSIDPRLRRPDDGGQDAPDPNLDGTPEDASTDDRNLDAALDIMDATPEASLGSPHSGDPATDGTIEVEGLDAAHPVADSGDEESGVNGPCEHDRDCEADAYCTDKRACAARCGESFCVGPKIDYMSDGPMLGDENAMFWTTRGGSDHLGTPLLGGAIWRWDHVGEPELVTSGYDDPKLELLADDYLYFRETGRASSPTAQNVRQVLMRPGSTPELLNWLSRSVDAVWTTTEYLWWTHLDGAVSELWRRPRRVGADEKVKTASLGLRLPLFDEGLPARWEIGNNQGAVFQKNSNVYMTPLDDQPERVLVEHTGALGILMNEQYAVYWVGCRIMRVDLQTLVSETLVEMDPLDRCSASQVIWRGRVIYWLSTLPDNIVAVGRAHVDLARPAERIRMIPLQQIIALRAPASMIVQRGGAAVTVYHPVSRRLMTFDTPFFCSDTLPCTDGASCGADQICH